MLDDALPIDPRGARAYALLASLASRADTDPDTPVAGLVLIGPRPPDAPDTRPSVPVRVGVTSIGRTEDNTVVVPGYCHRVSRRHCVLVAHPSGVVELRDLGSPNGTFVNGEQVPESWILGPGDVVTLAAQFVFELAPPVAAAESD